MKIKEAIDRADGFKPNQYSEEDKVKWLSDLDYQIYFEVLCEHEPVPKDGFVPYSIDDINKELIVGEPFTDLYVDYLKMKVDEANEETARYNNSLLMFNAKYSLFAKDYHKKHKPLMRTKFRLW